MKIKAIIFGLVVAAAAGCHDASKDIEKFADRACACKDAKCSDAVLDDFAKWAKDNKNARGDQDKAAKAAERIGKCVIEAGSTMDKVQAAVQGL